MTGDVESAEEEGKQNSVNQEQTEDALSADDGDAKLDPPLSTGENMRDSLLQILDSTFFQYLGIIVLM